MTWQDDCILSRSKAPPHTQCSNGACLFRYVSHVGSSDVLQKKRTLTNYANISKLDVRFLETRGIVQNESFYQFRMLRLKCKNYCLFLFLKSSIFRTLFGNNCEETSRGALQDASGADASSAGAPPHQCTAGGHVTWTSEWAVHNSGFRFSAGVRRPKRRTSSRSEPRTTPRSWWITSLASREVAIVMAGASIGQAVEELPRLWKIFAGSAWVYNQAVL